jgi:site-specific DNA-methyltransferase (adenine-specific)
MATAIEDAGFEIRDMIAWVYGSGFSKSMDVSKAIDKGEGENRNRQLQFTTWMRSTGITAQRIAEATGTSMASHYLTAGSQPAIATADLFDKMRPYLPEVPEEIERLVAERTGIEWTAYKNREVVGQKAAGMGSGQTFGMLQREGRNFDAPKTVDITAPATEAAKQWQGWGTALKPALEPITWARKPLIGTVAANVLQHGTGAVNVDGCKVDGERLPANFIHDGSEEAVSLLGEADRYFYCAKADASERRNSKHPTIKPVALMRYLVRLVTPPGGLVLDPFGGSGTTAEAARLEHCRFLLMELSPEYCADAAERLRQGVLF